MTNHTPTKGELDQFPKFHEHKDLIEALKNDKLVIFLGSGPSIMLGCLSWPAIGQQIASRLFEVGALNYSELSILTKDANTVPRKIISICQKIASEAGRLDIYNDVILQGVAIKEQSEIGIYKKILDLDPLAVVTTNIDKALLQNGVGRPGKTIYNCVNPTFKTTVESGEYIRDGNTFFLHGMSKEIDKIVFTVKEYRDLYRQPHIRKFMDSIFAGDWTVLFIGYGLNDAEVMEHMLGQNAETGTRRFALMPLHSFDRCRLGLDSRYHSYYSINVIPYFIDYEGHRRIHHVVDELQKIRLSGKLTTTAITEEIESVLGVPPNAGRD